MQQTQHRSCTHLLTRLPRESNRACRHTNQQRTHTHYASFSTSRLQDPRTKTPFHTQKKRVSHIVIQCGTSPTSTRPFLDHRPSLSISITQVTESRHHSLLPNRHPLSLVIVSSQSCVMHTYTKQQNDTQAPRGCRRR